ncbi:hypothetical protein LQ564_24565 [Massilia sp. G4R7]|uniref:Tfp pilus assembly protein PilX n=1 Tax=Massilia phyllostachyos TaxID=2898585 RepID=A0ABS8QCJ5_9BURK|nr:hypothetical protein [Massilia phyllostachyos]MCD2519482.1 hypothetical protein [Massilia phyllostachyos]
MTPFKPSFARPARGIALPVMLIMLLVLLVSSIYLLRSSNSTTLTASNLAYDAQLARASDFGLHTGFQWLSQTAAANKALLNAHVTAQGYRANMNTKVNVRASEFWNGSREIDDGKGNRIRYVIHRMCSMVAPNNAPGQACVRTTANTAELGNTVRIGDSMKTDTVLYNGVPQIHYVITARIDGPRGGNVITQMVVLLGA